MVRISTVILPRFEQVLHFNLILSLAFVYFAILLKIAFKIAPKKSRLSTSAHSSLGQ